MDIDTPRTTLLDLPVDILYLIFPYLDVSGFVALTSTCKALHDDLSQNAPYWRTATRSSFRVPDQRVVHNDGERWKKMYRRFLTQSRVYTWGKNDKYSLGHSVITSDQWNSAPPALRSRMLMLSQHVKWPTEMEDTNHVGIVADMQCGGWSTTLLSSKGTLHTVGVLDGLQIHRFNRTRPPAVQRPHATPQKLRYPPGYLDSRDRYNDVTAVKQFSAGRSHILAVSDSGRIWSWQNIDHAAYNVKFLNIEVKEKARENEIGFVQKVVAGWNKSSALINGAGIVLWDPLKRDFGDHESEEDTALVLETAEVPLTAFRHDRYNTRPSTDVHEGELIGEIQNYILLEDHVVFCTHSGKVFACTITWNRDVQSVSNPVEILLSPEEDASEDREPPPFATDIQGSFRSFAIFTNSGAVLTGNNETLDAVFLNSNVVPPLKQYPALQNNGVISLAFGDYHFHALHANGHITSYGNEPQGCGALGLGGYATPEGRLRGLRYEGANGSDARLVPHAYTTGRRVWFEQEKRAWITFLTSGGVDPEEARLRMRMCQEINVQGEVSEWIEQEGRAWEDKFGGKPEGDDDGLGAYFAYSVTAAGWHSGALVLVNDELADRVSKNCLASPPPEDDETNTPVAKADEDVPAVQGRRVQKQRRTADISLIARAANYTADWLNWALRGFPLSRETSTVSPRHDRNNPSAFLHPTNHGAADRDGRPFAWATQPFPRLVLSDGREMSGESEFSEWRYGRPEWDLSVQV